jgi:hypothetical protein
VHYESDFASRTAAIKSSMSYDDAGIEITPWSEVLSCLQTAVRKIVVHAVHATRRGVAMTPSDLLYDDYPDSGLHVIAVGGGKLSRGLTLEGLSISYFLRTTRMYDSLMQMGRWFGYRMGYADLCRIYTTPRLFQQFRHITMATEEMRRGFDEMFHQGLRPVQVQLKVRTDPRRELLITAANRMRTAERTKVTFGGRILQTYKFDLVPAIQKSNADLVRSMIGELSFIPKMQGKKLSYIAEGVDSLEVISLLDNWNFHSDLKSEFHAALAYWRKQVDDNVGFLRCNVAIPVNSSDVITSIADRVRDNPHNRIVAGSTSVQEYILGESPRMKSKSFYRNIAPDAIFPDTLETTRNNAILDASQRKVDLDISGALRGKEAAKAIFHARSEQGPLIVLVPLDSRVDDRLSADFPLFGLGLILPSLDDEVSIEYMVNQLAILSDEEPDDFFEDDTAATEE